VLVKEVLVKEVLERASGLTLNLRGGPPAFFVKLRPRIDRPNP